MADDIKKYSTEELAEFAAIIQKKMNGAKDELKYYSDAIDKLKEKAENDSSFNDMEDGSSHVEKEYLIQNLERQRKYIANLEKAMLRIENGTYGICRETGNLISKERLRVVPHATLSIDAKLNRDKRA